MGRLMRIVEETLTEMKLKSNGYPELDERDERTPKDIKTPEVKKIIKSLKIPEIVKITSKRSTGVNNGAGFVLEIHTSVPVKSPAEDNKRLNDIKREVDIALQMNRIKINGYHFNNDSGIFVNGTITK